MARREGGEIGTKRSSDGALDGQYSSDFLNNIFVCIVKT